MPKSKNELEQEAVENAAEGLEDMAEASEKLQAAREVAGLGDLAGAAGVSERLWL